jgi:hypothetical protein
MAAPYDLQDALQALFDWLHGPPLAFASFFPIYDREAMPECDRPWHCLEVTRVLALSAVFHL